MGNVFFTSDPHLGHSNMLDFRSERHGHLFPNTEYMNQYIVDKWNSVVKSKNDIVWVLGDVAMQDMDALHYLYQCNGRKRLIMGNHDTEDVKVYLKYFESVHAVVKKYGWVMTHVPVHPQELVYRTWKRNVHGHIHHKERLLGGKYHCVNADIRDFLPVSINELRVEVAEQEKLE